MAAYEEKKTNGLGKVILYGCRASGYTNACESILKDENYDYEFVDAPFWVLWQTCGYIPAATLPDGTFLNDSAKIIYAISDRWTMEELCKMRDDAADEKRFTWLLNCSQDIIHLGIPARRTPWFQFFKRVYGVGFPEGESFVRVYLRLLIALRWGMNLWFAAIGPKLALKMKGENIDPVTKKICTAVVTIMERDPKENDELAKQSIDMYLSQVDNPFGNVYQHGFGIVLTKRYGFDHKEIKLSWRFIFTFFMFMVLIVPNVIFCIATYILKIRYKRTENDTEECVNWAKEFKSSNSRLKKE